MKHLGFVGKATEHIGFTHIEIINSSLRLSFKVASKGDVEATFKKVVESNYDLLMETSTSIEFEVDIETLEKAEQIITSQGIEVEELIQNILIQFINKNESIVI